MALTAAEKLEMAQLEKEVGQSKPVQGGLTPEEQAEMQALEAEVGQTAAPEPGVMDRLKHLFSPEAKKEAEAIQAQRGAEQDRQRKAGTGLLQTEIEQTGDALAFGHLPQIEASLQSLAGQDYVEARDANIARLEKQREEHPLPAATGAVTGTLAGAYALPMPGMAKAAGMVKGALKGAAYGGVQGAIQNPGDVEGEINPLQVDERIENAKSGAKFGGVVGGAAGAGQAIAKGVQKLGSKMKGAGETAAFKSSGAMLKDFRQAAGKDEVNRLGRFMLDEKMVQAGDTVETVAQKAGKIKEESGKQLESVYNRAVKTFESPEVAFAGQAPGFNPVRDQKEILDIVKKELGDSTQAASASKEIKRYLKGLADKYGDRTLDPRLQNDIKGAVDDAINYARNPLNKQPGSEKGYSSVRKYLSQKIDESVEYLGKRSGDPKLAQELKEANKRYGSSKRVEGIAKDKMNRVNANNAFGLTDRIAGGAGAVMGGAAAAAGGERDPGDLLMSGLGAGLLAAGGNAVLGKYGNATLSRGLDRSGGLLRSMGEAGQALMPAPGIAARLAVGTDRKKKKGLITKDRGMLPLTDKDTP